MKIHVQFYAQLRDVSGTHERGRSCRRIDRG